MYDSGTTMKSRLFHCVVIICMMSVPVLITIDDPKTYTKPWTTTIKQHLLPDTELLEFVCEQNLDPAHLVGK